MRSLRAFAYLAASALCWMLPQSANVAAAYPDKPIRLIVGYAPGGGTDRLGRVFGEALHQRAGVPVVVENRTGATGTIAANFVAKSKPDAYTLLFSATSDITAVKFTMPSIPYNAYHDFTPIGRIAITPFVFVVNNEVPAKTMPELETYIKAQPGTVPISAAATLLRLTADLFKVKSNLNTDTVLYSAGSTPMADLLGGRIKIGVDVLPSVLPHVKAGSLRALAVVSPERSPMFPDVPTMTESGYKGFNGTVWYALLAPPGLPDDLIKVLAGYLKDITASDEFQKRIIDQGYQSYLNDTPAAYKSFLAEETDRWGEVTKQVGFEAK